MLSSYPASAVQSLLPPSPPLSPFSLVPPFPKHWPPGWASCSWAGSPVLRVELTSPALCIPPYLPHFGVCISHHYHPHHDCRMPVAPPVAPDLSCPRPSSFPHHLPNASLGITFHLSSLLEPSSARDFKKYGWKGPLKVTSSRSSTCMSSAHSCAGSAQTLAPSRRQGQQACQTSLTVHRWHWAQWDSLGMLGHVSVH